MTDIEQEARDRLNAVCRERGYGLDWKPVDRRNTFSSLEALCRALEQRDAEKQAHADFRQRVSDEAERILTCTNINKRYGACLSLNQFIIPKPVDPLVEAIRDFRSAYVPVTDQEWANDFRAVCIKHGIPIPDKREEG